MIKILIATEDDRIWALAAWNRAIPELAKQFRVDSIWLCDTKFSSFRGLQIPLWYLKTFGWINFSLLSIFAVCRTLGRYYYSFRGTPRDFGQLASKHNLKLRQIGSPNEQILADYVRDQEIDVVVIMVGHILRGSILEAPRVGLVNKHAAMLPANKGLLPYFWALLNDTAQGVSFHRVVRQIDEGELLYQEKAEDSYRSMVDFYFFVFSSYPRMLKVALGNLIGQRSVSAIDLPSTYFSLPNRQDYKYFRQKGGHVIKFKDLWLAFKL